MTKKPAKFIGTLGYERPDSIRFEYNSGEVVTVEGEALTIQEIFERNLNNHDPLVDRDWETWVRHYSFLQFCLGLYSVSKL